MSVSIRNVEKYLNDHQELAGCKDSVLNRAQEYASPNGIISGGAVKFILGEIADDFLQAVTTDNDHIALWLEDIKK